MQRCKAHTDGGIGTNSSAEGIVYEAYLESRTRSKNFTLQIATCDQEDAGKELLTHSPPISRHYTAFFFSAAYCAGPV
jgi:hypothetical protein